MNQILLYQSEDGRTKLDVRLENHSLESDFDKATKHLSPPPPNS